MASTSQQAQQQSSTGAAGQPPADLLPQLGVLDEDDEFEEFETQGE